MNPRISTSNTDKEMVTIAEEELARLRRQLRIMEDDKAAFLEGIGVELEKQRRIIHILVGERNKILEDNAAATSMKRKRSDRNLSERVIQLLDEYEKNDSCTRNEKDRLEELEFQIKKMNGDISNIRPKSVVTNQDYRNRINSGHKSILILQSRLDIDIKRFCSILSENERLREDINHLLNERSNFNAVWKELLKVMNGVKTAMAEWIERATVAFDHREDWCSKLVALRKRAENDSFIHSEEMRDIQRKLDHDLTLNEFLSVKGQIRILRDLEEKEDLMREKEIQDLENQLLIYGGAMEQIQIFCGEEDVHHISSRFLKQEEENFALFNYVNELNYEIELISQSITEIEEKISVCIENDGIIFDISDKARLSQEKSEDEKEN